MSDDDQLLGLSEVAALLRTSRQVIGNWRQRRQGFPPPIAELRSGPIWRRPDITEWAASAGVAMMAGDGSEALPSPDAAAATVALMNMKGGVGKSTVAANLGWFCAYRKNMRVLLVDLDPQFNLSQYVLGTAGYESHRDDGKGTVLDVFEQGTPVAMSGRRSKRAQVTPDQVIARVKKWADGSLIDLVPSSLELAWTLKNPTGKEQLLANFLAEVRGSYDLILIDCAPTESVLTTAAYLASDSVLIPVKPEFLSTIGLPLVASSLAEFETRYKQSVSVLGILFNGTMEKQEHDRSRTMVRKVAKENDWYVFQHEISYSDSYPKGSRYGKPIFLTDYARGYRISNFMEVAEEFVGRVQA